MTEPIKVQLNHCLFFSVKKLDRVLNKYAEQAFKPVGLAPTYGFILLVLREKDGQAQKEIAETLATAPSTIARFVEKLKYQDLVTVKSQGRLAKVYLTQTGIQKAAEVETAWLALHAAYEKIIGHADSQALASKISQTATQLKI